MLFIPECLIPCSDFSISVNYTWKLWPGFFGGVMLEKRKNSGSVVKEGPGAYPILITGADSGKESVSGHYNLDRYAKPRPYHNIRIPCPCNSRKE